jgi:hypothetical protein
MILSSCLASENIRPSLVGMPETPMDEYCDPMFREYDIRLPRQICAVQSKTEAASVQNRTDR